MGYVGEYEGWFHTYRPGPAPIAIDK